MIDEIITLALYITVIIYWKRKKKKKIQKRSAAAQVKMNMEKVKIENYYENMSPHVSQSLQMCHQFFRSHIPHTISIDPPRVYYTHEFQISFSAEVKEDESGKYKFIIFYV